VSTPGWQIRRGTPADLAGLVSLEQACFAIPWSEDSLRRDLEENPAARYLVAALPDGSLAGYAACWVVLDEAQITNISVLPAFRRQGLGRQLLQSLVRLAENDDLHLLTLEVRSSNTPARHLYEGCGFQAAGLRRHYYSDNGEDAIIMLKKIG
jgi:[ribosomal protein S18]-alanine N-acetyltransferase